MDPLEARSKESSNLGVITFPDCDEKIKFYEKLNSSNAIDTTKYHFFDNQTFAERIRDKRLGFIKHCMMETGKYDDTEVKILWRKQMVTLRQKKVAWYENDQIQMTKAATNVEQKVEEALRKWIAKRSKDPETDSD